MFRKLNDLMMVMAVAGVAFLLTLFAVDIPALRTLLALPLVLVLPGYALTAAVFPRTNLGVAERLLFSVGSSLAVAVFGGFALNLSPWGLHPVAWAALLCSMTVAAAAVALFRRRGATSEAATPGVRFNGWQWLQLGLASAIVATAIVVARLPAPQQGIQGYALLWMLPPAQAEQHTVRVGISSHEFTAATYRLQLEVDGKAVQEWPSIALKPGETWEQSLDIPIPTQPEKPVTALLYRLDNPSQVYRRVAWWPANP